MEAVMSNKAGLRKLSQFQAQAYGDTALYPSLQNLIHDAMNCDDRVIQPQEALNIL
jgi:hypothetical protein